MNIRKQQDSLRLNRLFAYTFSTVNLVGMYMQGEDVDMGGISC